jgi:hypothetical protein
MTDPGGTSSRPPPSPLPLGEYGLAVSRLVSTTQPLGFISSARGRSEAAVNIDAIFVNH